MTFDDQASDRWVRVYVDGEHSPAATLVLRHRAAEIGDEELIESLLSLDYLPGPALPRDGSPEEQARWWTDVESWEATGPGTWGELDSMALMGHLPRPLIREVSERAMAIQRGERPRPQRRDGS